MKFNNKNVQISQSAEIGYNVKIGDNTIIYDNVKIGENSIICNDCIIGEPLDDYYQVESYLNPILKIGSGSLIRSHSIIYAGSQIGKNFKTGHRVTIRENTTIGSNCNLGTLCDIQGDVIIGDYCHFHSNVHISQKSEIGNFVFMYPFSVITNDPYPPSNDIKGSTIGDYTQIGVHSVILPGIRIGENCLIGANSLVSRQIKDYSLVSGIPSKTLIDVRKMVTMGRKGSHYPWMYHFEKNMPWAGIGFDIWKESQK